VHTFKKIQQTRCLKNQDPGFGSGINIPDHISESLETIFGLKIVKFFDVDPDPGSGINIPDPQHR
jgi:hypothetical protein